MNKNMYKEYDWKQVSTQRKYWTTENQKHWNQLKYGQKPEKNLLKLLKRIHASYQHSNKNANIENEEQKHCIDITI